MSIIDYVTHKSMLIAKYRNLIFVLNMNIFNQRFHAINNSIIDILQNKFVFLRPLRDHLTTDEEKKYYSTII